jgi:hypothetical protein
MQNSVWSPRNRPYRWALARTAMLAATAVAPHAAATTITDVAYFTNRAHTLVTFEQRGNGNPTSTANATLLPVDEYSQWGFTFAPGLSPGVAWINDPSGSSDAAQAVGGSLHMGIAATDNQGDFFIHFAPRPITAFGFWVQHTRERSGIPTFDAVGASGVLERALFSGPAIDGRFGNIDYGFLGMVFAMPIQSIHVRGDIALLDNFRFITVPEPGGAELSWLIGLPLGCVATRALRSAARSVESSGRLLLWSGRVAAARSLRPPLIVLCRQMARRQIFWRGWLTRSTPCQPCHVNADRGKDAHGRPEANEIVDGRHRRPDSNCVGVATFEARQLKEHVDTDGKHRQGATQHLPRRNIFVIYRFRRHRRDSGIHGC